MVGLEIMTRVEPDKRQEFLQTFRLLSRPDKRADACKGQSLYEDVNEPNRFIWSEIWRNSETLAAHLKTEQFNSLLGAIDVLGKLETLRTVTFESV